MTIETFDQSGKETWPDQQKDNDKYKDKDKGYDNVDRAPVRRVPQHLQLKLGKVDQRLDDVIKVDKRQVNPPLKELTHSGMIWPTMAQVHLATVGHWLLWDKFVIGLAR